MLLWLPVISKTDDNLLSNITWGLFDDTILEDTNEKVW